MARQAPKRPGIRKHQTLQASPKHRGQRKKRSLLKEKNEFSSTDFPRAPSKRSKTSETRKKGGILPAKERPQKSECRKEGPLPIPIITQASCFLDAFEKFY